MTNAYRILVGKIEDVGIDGRFFIRINFKVGECELDSYGSGWGPDVGCFEHIIEIPVI